MDQHKAPPRPPNSDKVNPEPFQPSFIAPEEPMETARFIVPEPPNIPVSDDADDSEKMPAATNSSQSKNTRMSYDSAWKAFERWCFERSLTALPADTGTICAYLADCSERGLRIATIRAARAAVGDRHWRSHGSNPTATPKVKAVLSELARHDPRPQHRARPLTAKDMDKIRATACNPRKTSGTTPRQESSEAAERRGRKDIAIISLLRDSLLRRSELAWLRWCDVQYLSDGSGRITIRNPKGDQVLFISQATVDDLENLQPDGVTVDSEAKVIGLSASQIHRRFCMAVQTAGLGPGYSSQSGRVGMARDLDESGTDPRAVMAAGRWKSARMPALYTRRQTDNKDAVAEYYKRQSTSQKLPQVARGLRGQTKPRGKGARAEYVNFQSGPSRA